MAMISSGNPTNNPRKAIVLILICGLGVGVAFNIPFFIFDTNDYFFRMAPFRQITLGMSQDEAINILQKNHIACAIPEKPQSTNYKIGFSDFWREYTIYFHPVTHRVVRKVLVFRDYDSPIKLLLNREK